MSFLLLVFHHGDEEGFYGRLFFTELLVEVNGVATLIACREHRNNMIRQLLESLCDGARAVVRTAVAVQTCADHHGLLALVGVCGDERKDCLYDFVFTHFFSVLIFHLIKGNQHNVGLGSHSAEAHRRYASG